MWLLGAAAVIAIILGVWWWQMGSSVSQPVPYGTATTTNPLASGTVSTTKPVVAKVRTGTIVSVLSTLPSTSRFSAILSSSGVAASLGGKGPYTLFVPINESFTRFPTGMTSAELKRLVQYHIISGKNIDVNIEQSGSMQALSRDMLNFSVRPGDQSARVNSSVTLEEFTASNGTIYLIDQILLPPLGGQQ